LLLLLLYHWLCNYIFTDIVFRTIVYWCPRHGLQRLLCSYSVKQSMVYDGILGKYRHHSWTHDRKLTSYLDFNQTVYLQLISSSWLK
jgi:hypothetical protein